MGKKVVRVGFDFDGVVAYNPLRIFRTCVAYVKRNVLGIKKLSFIYPQGYLQRVLWTIVHESSVFPSKGTDLMKQLAKDKKIEAYLVTGRYSFLDNQLSKWLEKNKLKHIFKSVNINKENNQPHLFKEEFIRKYKLDYFIEDNLDIVEYLSREQRTTIMWIYNILDRNHPYKYKYPYLEKALEDIMKNHEA